MSHKGRLITFEGSEGSGKSTQIQLVRSYLRKKRIPSVFIREPGGVKISEKIRHILLDVKNTAMGKECETLLYMAARAQLVREVLLPELKKGKVVLCDRFLDSTVVYQGYGHGIPVDFIKKIGQFATQGVRPDLTLFFDIDARQGLARIKRAKDRIERRDIAYHNRVRRGYVALAKQEPGRIKLIEGTMSIETISEIVLNHVNRMLGR